MSQDYLACLPDGEVPPLHPRLADALVRRGCRQRATAGDLLLFATSDLPVRALRRRKGWLIGHLFDPLGRSADADVDADLSPQGAEQLVRRFWGSYVALSAAGGDIAALRDPSGGLACYHAHVANCHYFTSLPHLLIECGLVAGEIDWSEIARSLVQHSARGSRTALRGIDELLPGMLLAISSQAVVREPVWNPWEHAQRPAPARPAEALGHVLSSTLGAWGRTLRRPLVEISGGLDSAIVAAGIAQQSPGASLITFAAAPGDPDETLYARSVAEHLGLDLVIVEPNIADVDLGRSLSAALPRPNARAFTQAADALSLHHGRAVGADAFVSGGGGDDVFCYLRTILPAIDRLGAEGVRAMLSSAVDIAVMNHSTVPDAIQRVIRRLFRAGRKSDFDGRFLSATTRAEMTIETVDRAGGRQPGKARHVASISTIHNYLEGHARNTFAPIVSPLLSQPIVECCLSIPSWQWCESGENRAVARRAFRSRLPRTVIERRSKGHFDGFCAALFDTNRGRIRSMLLGGCLAEQGLLDAAAITHALDTAYLPAGTIARLLSLIDVETWTAGWRSGEPHER